MDFEGTAQGNERKADEAVLVRRVMRAQPGPLGHPLGVAVGDEPSAAVGVLVPEDPVDHVGGGLDPASLILVSPLQIAGKNDRIDRVERASTHGTTSVEPDLGS
jgi:hypothetical protein